MIHQLRERRNEDSGFTLIELMVVVLIIAILVAIAVPTFLGARTRGQDRAAQSTAKNALTAGRVHFTDNGSFAVSTCSTANFQTCLGDIETSISFAATGTDSSGPTDVSVDISADPFAIAYYAVLSQSNTCFHIKDDTTSSGSGTQYQSVANASTACSATDTAGLTSGWATSW